MSKQSGSAFSRFAKWTAHKMGQPGATVSAVAIIVLWAMTGPLFGFSDTWQLIINTGTTIITFLMVFLIQHTQNRDTEALQVKLDELIRVMTGARNELLDAEDLDEKELERLRTQFAELANEAHHNGNTKQLRMAGKLRKHMAS
jgi:low affinity Fe/Cu permease